MRPCLATLLCLCLLASQEGPGQAQDPTPSAVSPLIIEIWWTDSAYPLNQGFALAELESQWAAFNASQSRYQVNLRLKASTGEGSLVNNLLAAQAVAPQALPDLILVQHHDLYPLIQAGMVRQVDEWLSEDTLGDLLPASRSLGQWQGASYAIPYLLEAQHLFYGGPVFLESPLQVEGFWELDLPLTLPAQNSHLGLVLGQYLAAGGRLQNADGLPSLDERPLAWVLNFYAEGVAAGLINPQSLASAQINDYWPAIAEGPAGLSLTDSKAYLRAPVPGQTLALPMATDDDLVILEGWLWALTTTDPELQLGAAAVVEWFMEPGNYARYSESVLILPAGQRALSFWAESDYLARLQTWLQDPLVLPLVDPNHPALLQLNAAWAAILRGEAVETVVEQALAALEGSP